MTEGDKEIWENYTSRLAPVAKRKRSAKTAKPTPEKMAMHKAAEKMPTVWAKPKTSTPLKKETSLSVLERTREKKLRQGEIGIEAKLDLHGMTQSVAYDALASFMRRSVKNHKRHLLIITGKGADGAGVLRTNLKTWLSQMPESTSILALRPASPKHGGEGAFYVILRKKN
jgi:DNA-nicking Smr family endonuclease